ncbi:MAG: UDP-3-O-acyl-N-acetylglucosamine deacetylase [Campylobacterales bacterium]
MLKRTLKKSIEIVGIGLHKGVPVQMKLEPLEEDSGIVFYRSDLNISVPLSTSNVTSTQNATTISKDEATIHTIEHFLSAIYAYGIDNLKISVNNEEMPILDGSSIGFCLLLDEVGVVEQSRQKEIVVLKEDVIIKDERKYVHLSPSKTPIFEFEIEFPHPIIKNQKHRFEFSSKEYKKEIARARTFGFLKEVQYLRSIGLALGGSLDNAIVLDDKKVLNPEGLRFKNEFVRHKILDAIGDLSLIGKPICAKYSSFAGSHKLNYQLVCKLLESPEAYEVVRASELKEEFVRSYAKI